VTLRLLAIHRRHFEEVVEHAQAAAQKVPSDTKTWSQIIVSTLVGKQGQRGTKSADIADGSDVKAANCWLAMDTPRFNGVVPSGRRSNKKRKPMNLSALDDIPFLFFVLWDETAKRNGWPRCRIWCVSTKTDKVFRRVVAEWYRLHEDDENAPNFQLHPPRFLDHNVFRNECGNLSYPLLLSAVWNGNEYELVEYSPTALTGACTPASAAT
jgi:MamI-like restriction endonuclease